MEAGVIKSLAQSYPTGEPLRIGRFSIRDDHPIPGSANIVETLVYSSNIATAQIADQMGEARMKPAFRALDFAEPAHIPLYQNGATLFPSACARARLRPRGYGTGTA